MIILELLFCCLFSDCSFKLVSSAENALTIENWTTYYLSFFSVNFNWVVFILTINWFSTSLRYPGQQIQDDSPDVWCPLTRPQLCVSRCHPLLSAQLPSAVWWERPQHLPLRQVVMGTVIYIYMYINKFYNMVDRYIKI